MQKRFHNFFKYNLLFRAKDYLLMSMRFGVVDVYEMVKIFFLKFLIIETNLVCQFNLVKCSESL